VSGGWLLAASRYSPAAHYRNDMTEDTDGRFILAGDLKFEALDWGRIVWLNPPAATGSKSVMMALVELQPGKGHDFHYHPGQEEVIHVLEGTVEQWLAEEKRVLKPGDSIFIAADVVHASFNVAAQGAAQGLAKLLVVVGPCVGEAGYGAVDVSGEAPWNTLR